MDGARGLHSTLSPPQLAHTRQARARNLDIPPIIINGEPVYLEDATPPPPPPPAPPPAPPARPERRVPDGFIGRVLVFFGLAGPDAKARSQFMNVIWQLAFGFVQYVVIIALLVVASHRESPTVPGISEWTACARPLGVWNTIWLVRVALACTMTYWEWRRTIALKQIRTDSESVQPARQPPQNNPADPRDPPRDEAANENSLPNTHLYRRFNLITKVLSLVWFLTAHVLEYSSVNTCRHSSPHLWWLTFGILCILYVMLLEIFLIGLLIFILGPILYLLYNIILLCLGRHPLQNPGQIRAEIKKIPKSVVDNIPLVLYIPAPTDDDGTGKGGVTVPPAAHIYPPNPSAKPDARKRKLRFAFFRRSKHSTDGAKTKGKGSNTKKGDGEGDAWEDNWVSGEYPFVRLEGHRAACAICLMDFDEPERKDKGKQVQATSDPTSDAPAETSPDHGSRPAIQEIQVDEVTQADMDNLKLEDAGEGPQPLRLLACGHVFHKTCLDPWLIDVSGRCPVCQRPVEIPGESTKKKRRRGQRTPSTNASA
ncbi:hypothetical protein BDW22DRAFT_1327114 [Trametopsis cervina]|nr:hypothetical protein BDW22DRAFT_1327114 [Trametopsis cervina]